MTLESLSHLLQLRVKCIICHADVQKYLSQMSTINGHDLIKHISSNNFIDTFVKYPFSLVFMYYFFQC